jgi:fructosamine-3-kinase
MQPTVLRAAQMACSSFWSARGSLPVNARRLKHLPLGRLPLSLGLTGVVDMLYNSLPPDFLHYIQLQCHSQVKDIESLKGGVISETSRVTLENGDTYVLKSCPSAEPGLYPKEADALQRLNLPGCPRVPHVVSFSESYLLMEDLGHSTPPSSKQWETFGRQVGKLHTFHNERFGFDYANYLGLTVQINDWCLDGYEFFVRQRILANMNQGYCAEILGRADREKIERFCRRLGELVPAQPASLSHGDLWHPNILTTKWGDIAYIDVYTDVNGYADEPVVIAHVGPGTGFLGPKPGF